MTNAVEKLAESIENIFDSCYEQGRDPYSYFAEDLLSNPITYMKPKPLEWKIDSYIRGNRPIYTSIGPIRYEISTEWEGCFCLYSPDSIYSRDFLTLEATQAAAYDHLCKQVKELY